MLANIVNRLGKVISFFSGEDLELNTHKNEHGHSLKDYHYPSLTEELPYLYYDPQHKLFFNKYNAGIIYKIIPLTGANEKIAEQLDTILRNKISDDYTLQVIMINHNQIGASIDRFSDQFNQEDDTSLSKFGNLLEQYYKNAAVKGFKTQNNIFASLRTCECYVMLDKVRKGKSENDLEQEVGHFAISLEASLTASRIGFMRCNETDFLHLMKLMLQQDVKDIYPAEINYNDSELLSHQVVDSSFRCEDNKKFLTITGVNNDNKNFETAVTVFSITKLPKELMLWNNVNNYANIFELEQSIPCNHIISVIYKVDDQTRAYTRANIKTRDLSKKAKSNYAMYVSNTSELASNWESFRDDLGSGKTKSVKMLYNVIIYSEPEKRLHDVEMTQSVFNYNGIKIHAVDRLQKPYLFVSLPFMFTGFMEQSFKLPTLMNHISSWNAVQYMPIVSDWQGTNTGILLPTLRHYWCLLNPFDSKLGTNNNIIICGTSGAGKSFLAQALIKLTLSIGGKVYVIDVGGSYKKTCESLNGTYIEYNNLAMNPFTHIKNIGDSIDDIVELFELLAKPRLGASDDDLGTIREAVIQVYNEKGNLAVIDCVKQKLLELYELDKQTYPTASILAKNLTRYCTDSEHGKAFNAPSSLNPNDRLTVIDLQDIKNKNSIKAPVLLSIFAQVNQQVYNSGRNIPKLVIMDEVVENLKDYPASERFIDKGYRSARRFKGSYATIAQGIGDFFEIKEARSAWDNSEIKLIMLQNQEALKAFQEKYSYFNEYEYNILSRFPNSEAVGYSQVLLKTDGATSWHRFFVDPFTLVEQSSKGEDFQTVVDYKALGMSNSEAIQRVAVEHYGDRFYAE